MAVHIGAMLGRLYGDARALRIDYKKGVDTMTKKRLNEKQIAAIEYLSLPKRGGMEYGEIAEAVGVDRATLYRWRRDDFFNDELKRQIVRNTLDRLPDVMESIPDHIINDGNAAMFRTLLQAHSLLTDKVEVTAKDSGDKDVDAIKADIARIRGTHGAGE